MRRALALLLALAVLAGCARDGSESIVDKHRIVIAVRSDLPSVGLRQPDGSFAGFDVDVARYIAGKLGKPFDLVPVLAGDRERVLEDGRADMVVATYTISQDRKAQVLFAGPYHISYQDILTRRALRITNVRELDGRRICAVRGSNAAERVVAERKVQAELVRFDDYRECLKALKAGQVDAVTTNDVILAGLAKQDGSELRLNNARFNEQRSGIGLRRNDVPGCEAVNRAITDMYQDGTATRLLEKWFAHTGLDLGTVAMPQYEGCS